MMVLFISLFVGSFNDALPTFYLGIAPKDYMRMGCMTTWSYFRIVGNFLFLLPLCYSCIVNLCEMETNHYWIMSVVSWTWDKNNVETGTLMRKRKKKGNLTGSSLLAYLLFFFIQFFSVLCLLECVLKGAFLSQMVKYLAQS